MHDNIYQQQWNDTFFQVNVDIMKKLLFTLPKAEMNDIMDRYLTKIAEPLNRQFPDRVSKEEAVKGYKERKQMKKELVSLLYNLKKDYHWCQGSFKLLKFNLEVCNLALFCI